jgi:hypothetical protein
MAASALIEHQIPGRVRLKLGSKRGEVGFFESVVEVISKHPGVEELSADPLTGSIIIRHSGALEPILAAASEHQLFKVEERGTRTDASRARAAAQSERQHPGLFDAISVGLGGLGLLQVTRGEAVGSAAENFWNAYGAHRLLRNPPLAAGFAALGVYQLLRGQFLGSASSLFFYALITRQVAAAERPASGGAATEPPNGRPAPAYSNPEPQ